MTFSALPPPVTTRLACAYDSTELARAVLGGYACTRCGAGLREMNSDLCRRCEEQSDRITECAEAFWRELRAR